MNLDQAILWGFAATIVLTTLLAASRGLGFTRMDIPFLLGSMFTENRDRAKWIGFCIHLMNGWVFALIYIATFHLIKWSSIWLGMAIALVHVGFVLIAGMSLLPSIHPRMASEQHGPSPARQLEPPGFLALNYGRRTPLATVGAHLIYGAMLGYLYRI
jgi:hypothetical protein